MARKTKSESLKQELREEAPRVETPACESIDFFTALLTFCGDDTDKREHLIKHKKSVEIFVLKSIPSLKASQTKWDEVLNRF